MTVGNEAAKEINEEGGDTAVAGVLDLGEMLELSDNGFDHDAPAQAQFVPEGQEAVCPVALDWGDEPNTPGVPEFSGQGLREVTCIGPELPEEALRQARDGVASIGVAGSEGDGEHRALLGDTKGELKTEEPARRRFAALGQASKDPGLSTTSIMANR
jgi:hypothetical protein